MKNFYKGAILFFGITLFSISASYAQDSDSEKIVVHKTSLQNAPKNVQAALKDYSGYKISKEVTYETKNKVTVYRFKLEKGNWTEYLLINEKGKIIGIDSGENSGS
jgi:outer membrane lipoprotein-sorting protein